MALTRIFCTLSLNPLAPLDIGHAMFLYTNYESWPWKKLKNRLRKRSGGGNVNAEINKAINGFIGILKPQLIHRGAAGGVNQGSYWTFVKIPFESYHFLCVHSALFRALLVFTAFRKIAPLFFLTPGPWSPHVRCLRPSIRSPSEVVKFLTTKRLTWRNVLVCLSVCDVVSTVFTIQVWSNLRLDK